MLTAKTLRAQAKLLFMAFVVALVIAQAIAISVALFGDFSLEELRRIVVGTDLVIGIGSLLGAIIGLRRLFALTDLVQRATDVMTEAASGNLNARITRIRREDEIGDLLRSTNHVLDMAETFAKETGAAMLTAGRGLYYRTIPEEGLRGDYRVFARQLNAVLGRMEGRATETIRFETAIKTMVDQVSQSTGGIHKTASQMATRSTVAGSRTLEVGEAAATTSERVDAVSAATRQLALSVNEISDQVTNSVAISRQAVADVEATSQRMAGLGDAVSQIGVVVNLIQGIAGQTNLLALNATIEAARAGESGKGFAVVAGEVKKLANQTAAATGNIVAQIAAIQAASADAAESITAIVETIERMNGASSAIAKAVQEQEVVTHHIAKNIEGVVSDTEQVSVNVGDLSAASAESCAGTVRVLWSARKLAKVVDALHGSVSEYVSKVR